MRFRAVIIITIGLTAIVSLALGSRSNATEPKAAAAPAAAATPAKKVADAVALFDDGVYDLIEFDGKTIDRSDDEWKKLLAPQQFYILRQAGTEAPYTGALTDNHERGIYYCGACGLALFRSKTKFESGTGWPSFYQPIYKKNVIEKEDRTLPGETRTEILCARCHSHIGHVFDDGPPPTGLRYCMNSLALKFKKESKTN